MSRTILQRFAAPLFPLVAAGLLLPAGCEGPAPAKKADVPAAKKGGDHDHEHHHHHHAEKGPHGGALVAIGDDAAHLEVVLDAETGKVTAYVLDGEAQNPITIKAAQLELTYTREHGHDHEGEDKKDSEELPESGSVTLTAVTPGDDGSTSEYAGTAEDLKGAEEFDAVLTSISIDDKEFKQVKFNYPKGNEHDHHHHH
jgi:hypothetical protein